MRLLLPALLVSALCACNSVDEPPVFIDIDYQVRCITCEPRSPDNPKRQVMLLNGEQGYVIDCHRSGDDLLSFSLSFDDPDNSFARHSIEVAGIDYLKQDPGSKCEVLVREQSNRYIGGCTDGDPTADLPCQIDIDVEGGVVSGSLLCKEIPNESIVTSTRHVVIGDTGDPADDDEMPARFEIHGCAGL